MKNYWNILQDHACFEYQFVFGKNKYDVELIKELLNVIVFSGWEFGIVKILDQESGENYCKEFLSFFSAILDEKKDINNLRNNYSFFQQAFPVAEEEYKNPHIIVTKLAFYDEVGEVKVMDVFANKIFYPLLNPNRVHLYHYSETNTLSPISLELSILKNRELKLRISSGLNIWQPYFKPDYDIDKENLEDFPLNKDGYIDNRELYLLNTPRLIGFIKKVRQFFMVKNGTELSSKNNIEESPIFPNYG